MTTTHPQEIELKLALPPEQADAFLKRMARRRSTPLQQDLITRYFDTPDFALNEAGVALRVRRVGRRWLQTLKTEGERHGGLSHRVEYEMPVAGDAPDWTRFPPEALAYVPEALRDQLQRLFETRFHRTAWLLKGARGAAIEVALDIGEVRAGEQSQPICEIELELKAGQPDALFELALAWADAFDCLPFDVSKAERGVRLARGVADAPVRMAPLALEGDMGVEDGFAAICQACLAQFQANLPGVLASDDTDYVHQARVALRRLRAALRLFRRVCVPPDALHAGLDALAAALGPARDWDVLCTETLPAIAPHCPDSASWKRGQACLHAHRAAVRTAMRGAVMQARPGAWLLAFQRWLLQRGWREAPDQQRMIQLSPLADWARHALKKGHRPIARGARDFARLAPDKRHALRIAIKRQRYAAEFFQALFSGRRQARYRSALRDAQDSLGRANDALVAWRLLASVSVDAGPMRAFVLGWLAAQRDWAAGGDNAQVQAILKLKHGV
ncbi:MAG: CHAD domain-containing protein [Thiobacillus sp.]|nr:CHAD domain-containing protein [Thiobacillus sp.]